MTPDNPFTKMQKKFYEEEAAKWSPNGDERDYVVGSFDAHNMHKDYALLFDGIDTKEMVALDFGCGPGRGIVQYSDLFKTIDGIDISKNNLDNAEAWACQNEILIPHLYLTNGVDLCEVPTEEYDLVYSTICLQHIPVHEIRYNLFKEFYRVLKPDGYLTFQMGFGDDGQVGWVDYNANNYEAEGTNGACDVKVTAPYELVADLEEIGFKDCSWQIRWKGPFDRHPYWIFFRCRKITKEEKE